jgi:hypothetical protein
MICRVEFGIWVHCRRRGLQARLAQPPKVLEAFSGFLRYFNIDQGFNGIDQPRA